MAEALKGQAAMRRKLDRIIARFPDEVIRALFLEAELIMTRSKRRFVPVGDSGNLQSTGLVAKPERRGRSISVVLAYGSSATPYALAVHEQSPTSPHNPPTWRGKRIMFRQGRAQYLRTPLMEAVPTLAKKIAARINMSKVA